MGITGLLPFVKVASSDKHLSHFQGQTAAIDSYCWLHKGAFGCAEKIAKGEPTTAYVQYCFKFITMLQMFHIKPIMVFDGRHLPAKKQTEVKRRESRQQAKKRAIEALSLGKVKDARSNFQRCIDITPEMAFELIKECRKRQIDCIVAPYEADPQLAFLNREKIADFVISEDSDLLTFGCERVLFKLNLAGNGTLVEANKLHLAMGERADEYSLTRFRHMCILSGCDYVDSLPGIGLKKALKFLTSYPKTPIHDAILRLPALLKMRKLTITKEYIDRFLVAEATFKHQIIFNPLTKVLEPLFDTGLMNTNPRYCCNAGLNFGNALGYQMAIGNLNPLTMDKIDSWFPTNSNICPTSIWKKLATTTSPITATITSYFQAQPSTSFHRPLILSKTPKKRNNITINPVPLSERENDSGISDEILLKMYSSVAKSPPAKRTRIHSEDDEELSSPVISRRKDIINPFLRNMNTKRKILFTDDATTLLRSDSEQIDTEIPGTSNAQITSANKDESIASSSSMENEFDTSNDTIIESSDESIDNYRDATTKPKVTNVDVSSSYILPFDPTPIPLRKTRDDHIVNEIRKLKIQEQIENFVKVSLKIASRTLNEEVANKKLNLTRIENAHASKMIEAAAYNNIFANVLQASQFTNVEDHSSQSSGAGRLVIDLSDHETSPKQTSKKNSRSKKPFKMPKTPRKSQKRAKKEPKPTPELPPINSNENIAILNKTYSVKKSVGTVLTLVSTPLPQTFITLPHTKIPRKNRKKLPLDLKQIDYIPEPSQSTEKKKRSVRKPRVQTPKETQPLEADKQLAVLPSIFTKSSSSQACRNTTTYDSPIVSVGQYPRSKYVLTEHNAVASAAQTNQETTPVKLQKYRKCPKITTNNSESSTKASTSGNTQYTPKCNVTNSLNTPTVTNTTQTPSKLSTPSRLTLCSVGNPKIPYIKEGSIIHVPAKTLIIKKMTPEKVTYSYASSNKPPCVRKLLDTSSNIFEPTKSANNSLRLTQAITKPITVTSAQVHSSTTTPTLALLKSSRSLQTIPKPNTTQVSVLKPQESATSHYFSTVKTVCATKKALLNQPSAKFAQDAKLAVFDAASSRDLTGGENVLPQSNILTLKCSASGTTSAMSKDVNVTVEGTSRLACLNQFSKTSKTTLNVCKKSLLIKIPKNKSMDANASTSEGAPNLVTLVCDKKIEILKVIETPKDVIKTVNIDEINQTQSQQENVTSDEDTIIEPILTNSNNGNKIEPLQESVVHQNPSNLIHRRHPQGGTQPGSIWDIGSQILDICKSNLAKMRKKSTETAEEPSENPTEESSEKPTENPTDETSEKPTEEFNESHEIIENVGAHETEGTFQNGVSGNVQMAHTTKQNEQITDSIEISDDSSHNTTNSQPQIIPKFESTKSRTQTGNNKPKDKKSKKNGKQNIKLNPNQPTLSHFGFKKM